MKIEEPLNLPRGSVRAILAIIIVVAGLAAFLISDSIPEALLAIISLVVGFYFGSRTSENTGTPKNEKEEKLPKAEAPDGYQE